MGCDAGGRVLGGSKESAEGFGGKPGIGVLGLIAGAGVLVPNEKRGRRCELLERD